MSEAQAIPPDWSVAMRWHDLLFLHWPMKPATLRPLIPPGLELDTFEGEAWIGVVPFWMSGIRGRWTPTVRGMSTFAELNVRTYVRQGDHAGVWFFSLDAANPVAVRAARWRFHLPYYDARMGVVAEGQGMRYRSTRTHRRAPPANFIARYRPTAEPRPAAAGLEQFLVERYCMFAADRRGGILRGDVHHAPWALQPAEAAVRVNTMVDALGFNLPNTPPLLHFSRRVDAVAWGMKLSTDTPSLKG